MNSAKRAVALAQILSRQCCTAPAGKPSSHFKSLKKKQAKFQVDDGMPVHFKGGMTDRILYQGTWVLIGLGSAMMLKLFWDLAVPKKA